MGGRRVSVKGQWCSMVLRNFVGIYFDLLVIWTKIDKCHPCERKYERHGAPCLCFHLYLPAGQTPDVRISLSGILPFAMACAPNRIDAC